MLRPLRSRAADQELRSEKPLSAGLNQQSPSTRGDCWLAAAEEQALREVLTEARRWGFLGPGPVEAHIAHARGFLLAFPPPPAHRSGEADTGAALDLGSGAGVPGLALALALPAWRWVLADAHQRRGVFLEEAVERLGLGARTTIVVGRAEELARRGDLRGGFDVVTARGFGPPSVTAECGAGFLRAGGRLLVSEPPDAPDQRWPPDELGVLGLRSTGVAAESFARIRVLECVSACPDRYPRRVGLPTKRPLF